MVLIWGWCGTTDVHFQGTLRGPSWLQVTHVDIVHNDGLPGLSGSPNSCQANGTRAHCKGPVPGPLRQGHSAPQWNIRKSPSKVGAPAQRHHSTWPIIDHTRHLYPRRMGSVWWTEWWLPPVLPHVEEVLPASSCIPGRRHSNPQGSQRNEDCCGWRQSHGVTELRTKIIRLPWSFC